MDRKAVEMTKEIDVIIRLMSEKILSLEAENTWLKSQNTQLESINSNGKAENQRLITRIDELERQPLPAEK